jgi:hypothetical protein
MNESEFRKWTDWWEQTYRKELSNKWGLRKYLELQKMAISAWEARAAIAAEQSTQEPDYVPCPDGSRVLCVEEKEQ